MTGRDLSVDEELSSSFEPCLMNVIGPLQADQSAVARHPAWGAGNRGMMKRDDKSAPTGWLE